MPQHLEMGIDMCGNTGMGVKYACDFYSDIMKGRFLCSGLLQLMKCGCTTMNLPANLKHGVESHAITQDKEIPKCAFCQQSDVHIVLGH
jgi:hypothetical protein